MTRWLIACAALAVFLVLFRLTEMIRDGVRLIAAIDDEREIEAGRLSDDALHGRGISSRCTAASSGNVAALFPSAGEA